MSWDPLKNLRYDRLPNEDIMSDKEREMATRPIDATNFSPDSAYFAQAQNLVKGKKEQFTLNEANLNLIDPQSRVYLTNYYNPRIYREMSYLSSQPPESKTRSGTRAVQKYLKETGHYTGKIDGWYGNQTKSAIKDYQYEYINQDTAWRMRNWFNQNIKSPIENIFSGDE
tara:strand:- start:1700 stop:2209 length:510 start_codon:yes stop_codon:yes gene_type:complete